MTFDFGIALDFASALALIAILAWYHGALMQRPALAPFAPIVMGLAFGLVAMLQMNAAFQPVEGLIFDLRAVPVALAGAFLGRRGLGACLVVALSARSDVGGIGMWPDMLGIALAGFAGLFWDRATRATLSRGVGHLMILAVAASVTLVPGLFLPAPLGPWFLREVVPVMFPLHLLAVTALAFVMERDRQQSLIDSGRARPSPAPCLDQKTSLATLEHAIADRDAPHGGAARILGVLVLDLSHDHRLAAWGERNLSRLTGLVRPRLAPLLRRGDLLVQDGAGRILVPLTEAELSDIATLRAAIVGLLSECAAQQSARGPARINVSERLMVCEEGPATARSALSLNELRIVMRTGPRPIGCEMQGTERKGANLLAARRADCKSRGGSPPPAHPRLFDRVGRLMDRAAR